MVIYGYNMDELQRIVHEYEALKHLRDTPAFKEIVLRAELEYAQQQEAKARHNREKAEDALRAVASPAARPTTPGTGDGE